MKRIAAFFRSSRFHLLMMAFWVVMIFPSVTWWKYSITLVLLYSIYANFVGHWGGYQAARVEEKQDQST